MRVVDIQVEPLTHRTFAPFGQIIGEIEGQPTWQRPRLTSWRMKFSIDGKPDLKVIRYEFQEKRFSILERHISHTETRVPLGGRDFIMVVAPPEAAPVEEDIRAFEVTGDRGIILWRGTWHSLDTYPVHPPYVDMAFISEIETQLEIEVEGRRPTNTTLTQVIDFSCKDVSFRVVGL